VSSPIGTTIPWFACQARGAAWWWASSCASSIDANWPTNSAGHSSTSTTDGTWAALPSVPIRWCKPPTSPSPNETSERRNDQGFWASRTSAEPAGLLVCSEDVVGCPGLVGSAFELGGG